MQRLWPSVILLFSLLVLGCAHPALPSQQATITLSIATGNESLPIASQKLAEVEEKVFGQQDDGTKTFAIYFTLLKSDAQAMIDFHNKGGYRIAYPEGLSRAERYQGPFLAQTHSHLQAETARHTAEKNGSFDSPEQHLWKERRYLANLLLFERLINDQGAHWHTLAYQTVRRSDEYRLDEEYRRIALALKTALLIEHAAMPVMLDGQTIAQDQERYDWIIKYCERIQDSSRGLDFCALDALEALYIAEKRQTEFGQDDLRRAAVLAYTFNLNIAASTNGEVHERISGALLAAKIARAHSLGKEHELAAASQAVKILEHLPYGQQNASLENDAAKTILHIATDWSLDDQVRQRTCTLIQTRHENWYSDLFVLQTCGGSVSKEERASFRLRGDHFPYIEEHQLRFLKGLAKDDLVRYSRARLMSCERALPSNCNLQQLDMCPIPDVEGHVAIIHCAQIWAEQTAITLDVTERLKAGLVATAFLRLDAAAWQRLAASHSQRMPRDVAEAAFDRKIAAQLATQAFVLIELERLPSSQKAPFDTLLQQLR